MPIYEYRCKECGRTEEFLILGEEDVPAKCRGCGSSDLERVMSPAALVSNSSFSNPGKTCCGREERCSVPPCSTGGGCRRDGQ